MRAAILTDTHWSARKASRNLHDYFQLFYDNVFFPALEEHGVETVIHMGDAFDSRKSIDYQSLEWAKRVVFDPLKKYDVHMIIGNHDTYYKNTNSVNSPELLLQTYPNIKKNYNETRTTLNDKLYKIFHNTKSILKSTSKFNIDNIIYTNLPKNSENIETYSLDISLDKSKLPKYLQKT